MLIVCRLPDGNKKQPQDILSVLTLSADCYSLLRLNNVVSKAKNPAAPYGTAGVFCQDYSNSLFGTTFLLASLWVSYFYYLYFCTFANSSSHLLLGLKPKCNRKHVLQPQEVLCFSYIQCCTTDWNAVSTTSYSSLSFASVSISKTLA